MASPGSTAQRAQKTWAGLIIYSSQMFRMHSELTVWIGKNHNQRGRSTQSKNQDFRNFTVPDTP
jgi:hypothetical protein